MFGSVDEWFYSSLLGINAAAPGFEKIIIKPQPAGDLTWAKGSYLSMHGEIKSEWKIEGNNIKMNVVIPVNTTADIFIPAKEKTIITENGKTIPVSRYENGYAVIQSGSGEYNFQAEFK